MTTKELLEYLKSDDCTSINYIKTLNEFDLNTPGAVYCTGSDILFVGLEDVGPDAVKAIENMQEQFNIISDSYLYNTTTVFKENGRTCINFPLCYGLWEQELDSFSIKADFTMTLNKLLRKYLTSIYSIKYSMHFDKDDEIVYVLLTVTLTKTGERGFSNRDLNKSFLQKLICSEFFNKDIPVVCSGKYTANNFDYDIYTKYFNKKDLFNLPDLTTKNISKFLDEFNKPLMNFKNNWNKLNGSVKESFNNIHKDVATILNSKKKLK